MEIVELSFNLSCSTLLESSQNLHTTFKMVFTDYYRCDSDTMNLGCGKYFTRMRYRRNGKKWGEKKKF